MTPTFTCATSLHTAHTLIWGSTATLTLVLMISGRGTAAPSTTASCASDRGVRRACSTGGRVLKAWKLSSATAGATNKASTQANTTPMAIFMMGSSLELLLGVT